MNYHDWLPSLAVKYSFSGKHQLRFTYFKGISRPALQDITFFSINYEDYRMAGKPFLKRTRADNIDLRYEWYPAYATVLQAGVFYKRLADPYEQTLLNASDPLYPIPSQGLPYTPAGLLTQQLRNTGTATAYGLELAFTHAIGHFSVTGNYTFNASAIHQTVKFKTREQPNDPSSDIITVSRAETRPLEGQSKHLANLSVVYKAPGAGITAQVAAVYTGKRIYAVSGWYNLDYWQRSQTWLDASAEKKLGRHFSLFAKAANLLQTATVVDILQPNPEAATKWLPGKQQNNRITTSRMGNPAVYRIGARFAL